MRALVLAIALAAIGCGDGAKCSGDAIAQCEAQCGGGPSQNICYPDPVLGADGCWQCFCQPCVRDMAMPTVHDLAGGD